LVYHLLRANYDGTTSPYFPDHPIKALPTDAHVEYQYGHTVTHLDLPSAAKVGSKVTVTYTDSDSKTHQTTCDQVVACDGPSSEIRKQMLGDRGGERKYVGYVAWRGTVKEDLLQENVRDAFTDKFVFFHAEGIQILAYLIPGKNGSLKAGERLCNWVWYNNYAFSSPEFRELMTAHPDGTFHPWSNQHPSPQLISQQKAYGSSHLPPVFASLVHSTQKPFIQAISDVSSPQALFPALTDSNREGYEPKVILNGDALAGFRPHTAASTSQAAFHALTWEDVQGEGEAKAVDWSEYERRLLERATEGLRSGVGMGERSQFGKDRKEVENKMAL